MKFEIQSFSKLHDDVKSLSPHFCSRQQRRNPHNLRFVPCQMLNTCLFIYFNWFHFRGVFLCSLLHFYSALCRNNYSLCSCDSFYIFLDSREIVNIILKMKARKGMEWSEWCSFFPCGLSQNVDLHMD